MTKDEALEIIERARDQISNDAYNTDSSYTRRRLEEIVDQLHGLQIFIESIED